MTDVAALKQAACAAIDAASATLFDISAKMHADVELAFEEVKAQAWQCKALRDAGLVVEEGLGSLKTAFRATATSPRPGPRIAFLCEYDGLPVYGQSCGHNVVAAAGVGAAIGFAKVVGTLGGTALALGTPGEEGGGGKNILHREGFFDGIDAMMLVYPGMDNIAHSRTVGATRVQVAYFGKAAHAAARPELGINALDALLQAFNGISALRQQLPSDVRVHWIITKGGTLPQVIPDHVTAVITVRANNAETLQRVIPRIDACLTGAAEMTGARLERTWRDQPGRELLSNAALARSFDLNLRRARAADPAARRDFRRLVGRHRQRELVRADDSAANGHDRARRAAPQSRIPRRLDRTGRRGLHSRLGQGDGHDGHRPCRRPRAPADGQGGVRGGEWPSARQLID